MAAESPTETTPTTDTNSKSGRPAFKMQAFTSLLLLCSFAAMLVSGVMLYLSPMGRVAKWTDWTLLGLGKEEWAAVHINNSILFLIAAVLHIYFNWRLLIAYLTKKVNTTRGRKIELGLAVVLTVFVVAGTLYSLPPFSTVMAWNEQIKRYWEARSPAAPAPHAEEFTVARLAEMYDLPPDAVVTTLVEAGFECPGPEARIRDVAESKGVPPAVLFQTLRDRFPQIEAGEGTTHGSGFGRGMGMGMGRGMGPGFGMGRGLVGYHAEEPSPETAGENTTAEPD
ncbi:hypothetical protein JCM19992_26520 [Thermostilla marina]